MDNMRIGGGLGIFKKLAAPKTDNKVSNNPMATNPFGLSFKGKLQGSDLFQKTGHSEGFRSSVLQKGKMAVSAAVGSLVQIKNTFVQKIEPIVTFAKETSHKISQIADKIGSFDASSLKISNLVKPDLYPGISREAKKLVSKSPDELEAMWHASLAHA